MKRTGAKPPPKPAKPAKARGRPRSFDRETALDCAMQVFWDKGFESASLSDLTSAMGINPPSLYAAFGDKERLFLEAVDRYRERQGSQACPEIEAPSAREAIEKQLRYAAAEFSRAGHPRGCLMVMAAATSSSCSAKMQSALAHQRADARAHLKERMDCGLKAGELPAGTDTGALADFYLAVLAGMSLQAREGASRKSLMATVDNAMRAWPETPKLRSVPRAVAA